MTSENNDRRSTSAATPLPSLPPLAMSADAIRSDFMHYLGRTLGRTRMDPTSPTPYQAAVYATRDRLMDRWRATRQTEDEGDYRRVCYLSLEYLMGRLLQNALLNLDVGRETTEALASLGLELEDVYEAESDAGLGNGGLGRLAACFLDSCATLALPVTGYGIRYHYGMFHQQIKNGYQVEEPDTWLHAGFPWEIERMEFAQTIRFGGRVVDGETNRRWVDTHDVLAIPFDVPIPGYRNDVVNTLRLWS
ncbi:MAG: glycogen/starch/alpha-glucan phosphorylase, partial [Woeseiaceae bacterium]|nr:glycogen/starch/alpha-glucan phosphorylase [Woeseiaceae bacterium]